MLFASFTSAGTFRWAAIADGGFSQQDFPLSVIVQNNDVRVLYYSRAISNQNSFGTQVLNKNTGALGAQVGLAYSSDTHIYGYGQFQATSNVVGSRPAPNSDGYIVSFNGSNPVKFGITGNSTLFSDIITTPSGTYVSGQDAAGTFFSKWDLALNAPIWRCALPGNFLPAKIGMAAGGDFFVAGTFWNADEDFGVCKVSSSGTLLAQGASVQPGMADRISHFTVTANGPIVVGTQTNLAGVMGFAGSWFSSDLVKNTYFFSLDSTYVRGLAGDAGYAYVAGQPVIGGLARMYKVGPNGIMWNVPFNQSPGNELISGFGTRNGELFAIGSSTNGGFAKAIISKVDPNTGNVIW